MPFSRINALRALGATLAAAVVLAIAGAAHAGDYHQTCGYETIGDQYNGGGTYYICRSTDKIGGQKYEHACAFAGRQTWCQDSTRRQPEAVETVIDNNPMSQAERAAIRATRPGPQEVPLCAGRMTRDGCQR
jgi:hypothetical protein